MELEDVEEKKRTKREMRSIHLVCASESSELFSNTKQTANTQSQLPHRELLKLQLQDRDAVSVDSGFPIPHRYAGTDGKGAFHP